MNVQKIKPIKLDFISACETCIQWPASLAWCDSTKPTLEPTQYYKISKSWDGYMTMWEIDPPIKKVPTAMKPRMWFCTKTKLWYCQRHLVRGSGTTKRYAWDSMWAKVRSA